MSTRRSGCSPFCSNAGPAFVVSAVGFGILGNINAGLILLGAQILSSLLIALSSSLFEKNKPVYRPMKPSATPISLAFVKAVTDSASAMMMLCAFVVVFAVILGMMDAFGVFTILAQSLHMEPQLVTAIISGFLEVTSGCKAAAECKGNGFHSALLPVHGVFRTFRLVSGAFHPPKCGNPIRSLSTFQAFSFRHFYGNCSSLF